MITRISSVIRPKGSDLIFDHPYNAEYALIHPVPSGADAARRLSITAQSHVISVARVLEGSGRNSLNLFLNLRCPP
jgi:hypothetical protein